ncbi:zinc metallopeptidase [Komarekiella sp. 'clone 1']|uniref:Zinc metallopeptidase n=1 Tax=Komarekiella delphini-convector SJRDD-AB1 TaxID=2593771 RepID=A0AA40VR59_9NOST|nr:zinc metallopeptidase [Komarekiella delphini-convector]MBD6616785.1 zinc metallopeptidase [Komarekiella delphini-convector SJRDD-AB1]
MSFWFYLFVGSAVVSSVLSFRCSSRQDKLRRRNLNRSASCGLTGYEVATLILRENNLGAISVQNDQTSQKAAFRPKEGKRGTIRLPPDIFADSSLRAIAISAHECGHALQYYFGRSYFSISKLTFFLFWSFIGSGFFLLNFSFIFLSFMGSEFFLIPFLIVLLAAIPGICYVMGTLQSESDATHRGITMLELKKLIDYHETSFVKQWLEASFLNYVSNSWLFATVWSFAMAGIIMCHSRSS